MALNDQTELEYEQMVARETAVAQRFLQKVESPVVNQKPRIRIVPNPIPPITAEMGQGWARDQPQPDELTFYQPGSGPLRVMMSQRTQNKLLRYDRSFPSGVYDGKMWVCEDHLVWFEPSPHKPNCCVNRSAEITIRETV